MTGPILPQARARAYEVPSFERPEPGNKSAQKPLSAPRRLAEVESAGLASVSTCDAEPSSAAGPPRRERELCQIRSGSAIDDIRRESRDVTVPAPTAGRPGAPDSASVKASNSSGSIPTRCAAAATARLRRPDRASSRMRTVSALDGATPNSDRSTGTEQYGQTFQRRSISREHAGHGPLNAV
jgi:hypothetical protein